MNKRIKIAIIVSILVICISIIAIKIHNSLVEENNNIDNINGTTEQINQNNEVSVNKILNIEDGYKLERPLVKLNIKETKRQPLTMMYSDGAEKKVEQDIIYINNYKLAVNNELVEKGYTMNIKNDILTITSKDNLYQFVMFQLSDNYVMPTEEEIDAFYETAEYKAWDAQDYDYEDEVATELYWDKYDEISTKYYKSLGYTAETSPDYVLTLEEMLGKYNVEEDSISSYSNGLFPGYQLCESYDWGRTTFYTIPKYYNDSYFGEYTSDISVCLYMIECSDESTDGLGWVDLDRF